MLQQEDHDLIPGEGQQAEGYEAANQPPPAEPSAERPIIPSIPRRSSVEQPSKVVAKPARLEEEPAKPPKKSWEPIDLSKGPVRGARVANRGRFLADLKHTIGKSWGSAETRGAVAAALRKASHGGLHKGETKKTLRRLERDETISPTQKRILRRKLGAL